MSRLESLNKLVRKINQGLAFAGMFLLIPLMLLTTIDVLSRSMFNYPIVGTYELSSYMLAVIILLGITYTYQVGGHVRIDMFVSKMPARVAAILDIFTTLLSILIISVLAWQGWVLALEETAVSEQLRIPETPFRMLVPLAAATLVVSMLLELIDKVSRLFRR